MRRIALLAALVCAGAAYWAISRTGGIDAAAERPNVLLVAVDTLRADAVDGKPGLPAFEAFLSEAKRFRRARTVAPLTLPAHVSMLTGLFPSAHGIHDNATSPLPPRAERPFPLLAEELRDAGYSTAAFVAAGVLAPETGIASGFETYDSPKAGDEWGDTATSLGAEDRVRAATGWMKGAPPGKPWFVWLHLFDPHGPYEPFAGDARRPATRDGDPPRELYAGEVRRVDAAIERLLAATPEGTVVMLVSDHGEALGERGELSHGPLCYGVTADVLLAVRGPGFAPSEEDAGLRSVADIAPTIRRLCGLATSGAEGRDLGGPPHETLVTESLFTWYMHGWGQCFAVTDGEASLVESGPRVELFDLRADPNEQKPLPLTHPSYEKLDRALERYRSTAGPEHGGAFFASIPPYGTLRRQVSGYLPRHENARLLDPREHLATWERMEGVPAIIRLALARRETAPLERARKMLVEIEAQMPTSPRVPHYRAHVCGALAELTGRHAWLHEAARAEIRAIELGCIQRETILPAIDFAVALGDRSSIQSLVDAVSKGRRTLDAETARALADAAARFGLEAAERLAREADAIALESRPGE